MKDWGIDLSPTEVAENFRRRISIYCILMLLICLTSIATLMLIIGGILNV